MASTVERVLHDLAITRLYVIIDEWATVPFDAQPYLCEHLKRGLLTIPEVSVKILAVNYQCQFSKVVDGEVVGLSRGADTPLAIDMDRYLVFDEKRDFVIGFFAQVLFNHLGVELGWDLSADEASKRKQVLTLFTHERAFTELVRAAEGNCRDFLSIFARAYFDEFRQSDDSNAISIPNVQRAAADWFDAEKAANVYAEEEAAETLGYLIEKVLKGYKSRTFLVNENKADHPRLTRLLNERVLHKVGGLYAHKDRPGERYCLMTMDYGTFVRLRATSTKVDEEVWTEHASANAEGDVLTVPIDDRRSIRRIVFDPVTMDAKQDEQLRFNFD